MVLLSLCTLCRHIISSQYSTAVPVHTMQAHNQQPVQYCCPCAHYAGTQPATNIVLLSLCTPCRHTDSSQYDIIAPLHTISSQYGTAVLAHTMQAHSQQPVQNCCPCAHHACTQPAASMVLLSLCTKCRHTTSSQYGTAVSAHTMQAHSQQPVQHCCPCAHHACTQPAASTILLSLCTKCRHTTSSQYGTAVPVHTMQAHSQQPVRYCCPYAQNGGTQPIASKVLLSLYTTCMHTTSSQCGTAVPVHKMQAHNQQPVQYCCPCAHYAGTQPAASTVLLPLCTPCRHTISSQCGTAVPVHTMQEHNQLPVWYCCPCAQNAGTQPAAITVLLSLWTP